MTDCTCENFEWPEHKCGLYLTHNQHKDFYETVKQAIESGTYGCGDDCWVSPEQKQKAIDTNECWTLQWYPRTPVSFYVVSGADLEVVLQAARERDRR